MNISHRDLFLLEVIYWTQEHCWKGSGAGWPAFDDAGGENGFIHSAFSIPEQYLPEDYKAAALQLVEYGTVANTKYYPDEDRLRMRPVWLPTDWQWSFE